jgi:TolB protein
MLRRHRRLAVLPATLAAVLAIGAVLSLDAGRVQAQGPGDDALPDVVRIKITDPTRDLIRIAVPAASGPGAGPLGDVLANDLELSGFFRVLDKRSFLANLAAEGLGIVPADWTNVGAQWVAKGLAKAAGDRLFLDFRLYQPGKNAEPVLSKSFMATGPTEVRRRVHEWAALVVKFITDQDSFFASRFAFGGVGHGVREIYAMDFDGYGLTRLTNMRSISMLPAWSPSGGQVAFTSFARDNPDLWIVPGGGGRARRVASYPGLNTGPAWSPDGSRIALTLSRDGNAEIYLIRPADGGVIARLTNDRGIDTSPTWSPDGSQIAFVSDRHGSPQVYVMGATGAGVRRLTFQGSYNQTPRWCPRRDTPLVAFSGRDQKGRYDVFTVDARTAQITRVTQGFGSNLDPAWAPNGRRLAFVNQGSKSGIWVVSPDGTSPVQVAKVGASGLSWGPSR